MLHISENVGRYKVGDRESLVKAAERLLGSIPSEAHSEIVIVYGDCEFVNEQIVVANKQMRVIRHVSMNGERKDAVRIGYAIGNYEAYHVVENGASEGF